jgi:lysophospholipase L1-like esterase
MPQTGNKEATNNAAPLRLLKACLAVAATYMLLVALCLALRLEAHRYGLILSGYAMTALRHALIFHAGVGVVLIALLAVAHALKLNRPIFSKLALAGMSLVLVASVDRLVGMAYEPFPKDTGLFKAHPIRGWTCRPGWVGRDERAGIRINRQGLRGPDIPLDKAPDEKRIVFLGDSVTFASHVEEEVCFVTRVQDLANADAAPGRITTLNASVPAYSPWQEYDLLANEGLRYSPDGVVLVFCLNDVLEKFRLQQYGGYSRGYEPPVRSRFEWSGLYRAARTWHAALVRPTDEQLWYLRGAYSNRRLLVDPDAPDVRKAWDTTLENVGRILSLAKKHSLPLAIICTPHRDQLGPDPPTPPPPQNTLAAFAAEQNVPFLDLLPVFREELAARGADPTVLLDDRVHLAPAGHELTAAATFEFLKRLGWFE